MGPESTVTQSRRIAQTLSTTSGVLTIYPRGMAWETAEPPASDGPESAQSASHEQAREDPRDERLGPLAITRHRKDDGRLLILYRRDEEP
jgi:hypothetical protein